MFTEIKNISIFLNINVNDEILSNIVNECCFENMKKHFEKDITETANTSGYFRKGTVDSWKETITVQQLEEIDEIVQNYKQ
ncbi:hypothetical protein A3Q56_00951 [Intoshia linei]|uniref:Sulfotransferase domain-containing protein n=1 Tax=Intoshia linei TaxID=1819745 RepID=A0A177BAE0_9BILA|nr:hypothetical protein A3Q56_00951 [Intoshia linei]